MQWLVGIFFQNWKLYEGWGKLTKQPDKDGSRQNLILSLLMNLYLLFHPEQIARIENKLLACTMKNLQEKIKVESLFKIIQKVISPNHPEKMLKNLVESAKDMFLLASSKKHMINRDWGHLESTPSLKY